MKVLIWVASGCVWSFMQVEMRKAGVGLGGLEMFLVTVVQIWVTRKLCSAWDIREINKKSETNGISKFEYLRSTLPRNVIETLDEASKDADELIKTMKDYLKIGTLTQYEFEILLNGYFNQE